MVKLNISEAQIRALEQGKNINVKPSQIGSGVEVDMDEGQLHRVQKCACSRTGRGVRIGGGAPRTTGATFGASLLAEKQARQRAQLARAAEARAQAQMTGGYVQRSGPVGRSGGKIKLKMPNAKQLKKAAQAAKMVGDAGAQMYGYDSLVDAGVSNAQAAAAERGYDNQATRATARVALLS